MSSRQNGLYIPSTSPFSATLEITHPSHSFRTMRSLLGCLFLFFTLCNAAALPKIQEASFNTLTAANKDDHVAGYTLNSQLVRRSTETTNLIVSLELINSGYCGNISVGSQDTSILTLFDLGTSQLSA